MSDEGGETGHDASAPDENRLVAERRGKLAALRSAGTPFPNDFRRDALAVMLQKQFADLDKAALEERSAVFSVAGRLVANRGAFLLIQDGSGRIQFYVDRKGLPAEMLASIRSWDLGDIVAATGPLRRSGKGDLYIHMQEARLLTKALRPLPDKYHGLADQELRYRRRYVDLIVNDEVRERFRSRSKIITAIRDYMNRHHFLEVETPMMHPVAGGAAARPFVTHHNALGLDMYLRIAPELYLKRLVVGGFERVYEINRNFRNEGVSTRHNPEFTMLEFYWAFADYRDAMDFTEKMLRDLAQTVLGGTELSWQGVHCDLARPFERLALLSAVQAYNSDTAPADFTELGACRAAAEAAGIAVDPRWGLGKLQLELFEKTVEPRLEQPTFIIDYPTEVSPLARRSDHNPAVSERFELFIGGREIANGFSELNDPEDQAERFRAQVEDRAAGDQEAMDYDDDYIRALEYGLPPTAGVGIGVDRLVMALTDSASIRDVLLFPHLRPEAPGA